MTTQPEALLLAELLETEGLDQGSTVRMDAAAELRRLHAENETLRYEVDAIAAMRHPGGLYSLEKPG